jgi:hypothetical protein
MFEEPSVRETTVARSYARRSACSTRVPSLIQANYRSSTPRGGNK